MWIDCYQASKFTVGGIAHDCKIQNYMGKQSLTENIKHKLTPQKTRGVIFLL